ncbi:MAG: putative thiamine transporter thiamine-binding protein [Ilumatobacteraceae bacterium]|nr:putative thiamine transporter thiamine-binding protein [Ilumatobacteraceae bacterium]
MRTPISRTTGISRRSMLALALASSLGIAACSSDSTSSATTTAATTAATSSGSTTPPSGVPASGTTLTIVAYDSFTVDPKSFDSFTAATGLHVKIVTAGDAGAMLSKAALTAGNPEGDVMWGVDNTLLSRALASKVYEPYTSPDLSALATDATALIPGHEATPVDEGDVCVNYDIGWLQDHHLDVPKTLQDLTDPKYKDLLVTENPATSSTGLAFLLATVARFGTDGWQQYWKDLRANGVKVVDGWDEAYDEDFSGSTGKGPRPLVVSYGSSPPAEVIYGDPKPTTAPTGVMGASCFHQVEFAGILRGTKHAADAGKLIDFLISKEFQETLPLTLFVYPARTDAAVPDEFTKYAVRPTGSPTVSPADIEAHSKDWIATWTDITIR